MYQLSVFTVSRLVGGLVGAVGKKTMQVSSAVAEFERNLLIERTK